MKEHDEYRCNAAEAQRQADRAKNDLDRASWLRIAQGWLSLLPVPRRTATEKFDQESTDKGTGQDDNKSSN
jgi:hypothetical protein